MAIERIYVVNDDKGGVRLVNASMRSQALSHVANSVFSVRVASQQDLVTALSGGTKVENYRDPDQSELAL